MDGQALREEVLLEIGAWIIRLIGPLDALEALRAREHFFDPLEIRQVVRLDAHFAAEREALVCCIEADGMRVLLMSDAGFFTEQWLLANEPDLHADALVMGWHDKDFSGTPDFLSRVQPRVIVCSEPPFGATPEKFAAWKAPLEQNGARVFPQKECGAVQMELRAGGEVSVVPVIR